MGVGGNGAHLDANKALFYRRVKVCQRKTKNSKECPG